MSYSKTFVGSRTSQFDYAPQYGAITGVNVTLDDGTEVFVGTDTNVLEVSLPVCNSTVEATSYANYILTALSGYQYQPYDADGSLIDPASQLGDGVTVRSVYGGIYARNTEFGRLMKATVAAPYEREINSEYPYVNTYERKVDRKYIRLEDQMEAEFLVQASQISAKVSKVSPAGQSSFEWAMNDSSHVWYANGQQVMRVDKNGLRVNGEVNATSGDIGGCVIQNGVLKVGSANVTELSIGTNFSVNSNGDMVANNATITGTLTVGGNLISATDLYTGAAQSAVSYGSWNNGTYYAYSGAGSYFNSIQSGTQSYPSQFKTAYLYVTQGISMSSAVYTPQTKTIAGVTIHYLGY